MIQLFTRVVKEVVCFFKNLCAFYGPFNSVDSYDFSTLYITLPQSYFKHIFF